MTVLSLSFFTVMRMYEQLILSLKQWCNQVDNCQGGYLYISVLNNYFLWKSIDFDVCRLYGEHGCMNVPPPLIILPMR